MKKNITKIAIALFFVLLVVANFALANSVTIPNIKQVQGGKAESLVGQILGLLQFAAVAIALAMLLIIGIKYITASPEGKADIKGTAIAYLIGAVCIFSAVGILNGIKDIVEKLNA